MLCFENYYVVFNVPNKIVWYAVYFYFCFLQAAPKLKHTDFIRAISWLQTIIQYHMWSGSNQIGLVVLDPHMHVLDSDRSSHCWETT